LKRVFLTLQKKKKMQASVSLTANYLQLEERVKLLNMIHMKKSQALKIIREYEQF